MTGPGEPAVISALTAVGFLNVCSLRGKVAEVTDFMSSRGVEVFGLAETWLKPSIPDGELAINNYNLFSKGSSPSPWWWCLCILPRIAEC